MNLVRHLMSMAIDAVVIFGFLAVIFAWCVAFGGPHGL